MGREDAPSVQVDEIHDGQRWWWCGRVSVLVLVGQFVLVTCKCGRATRESGPDSTEQPCYIKTEKQPTSTLKRGRRPSAARALSRETRQCVGATVIGLTQRADESLGSAQTPSSRLANHRRPARQIRDAEPGAGTNERLRFAFLNCCLLLHFPVPILQEVCRGRDRSVPDKDAPWASETRASERQRSILPRFEGHDIHALQTTPSMTRMSHPNHQRSISTMSVSVSTKHSAGTSTICPS